MKKLNLALFFLATAFSANSFASETFCGSVKDTEPYGPKQCHWDQDGSGIHGCKMRSLLFTAKSASRYKDGKTLEVQFNGWPLPQAKGYGLGSKHCITYKSAILEGTHLIVDSQDLVKIEAQNK